MGEQKRKMMAAASGVGAPPESIEEVRFGDLAVDRSFLETANYARYPTWKELYEAVGRTVDACGQELAGLLPAGSGHCLLKASLTRKMVMGITGRRAAVCVGRARIKNASDDLWTAFPGDDVPVSFATGMFHAWTMVDRDGTIYHADMSFDWFHSLAVSKPILGPRRYFVATGDTLTERGIRYSIETDADVVGQLDFLLLNEDSGPLQRCAAELRRVVGARRFG